MTRRILPAALLCLTCTAVGATDVAVVGVFPGKAVLVIDGDGPYTLPVGGSRGAVRLMSVDEGGAVVEVGGARRSLAIGAVPMRTLETGQPNRVVIAPDTRGHYIAHGSVNGAPVRFLVDTGATAVTLSTAAARRMGLDVSKSEAVMVTTANGRVVGRRVRLDRVALGDLVLHQVDAIVQDGLGDQALLGMTFLSRTELRREGDRLVLVKRL